MDIRNLLERPKLTDRAAENKDRFIDAVINQFGQEPRRLQFLFQE